MRRRTLHLHRANTREIRDPFLTDSRKDIVEDLRSVLEEKVRAGPGRERDAKAVSPGSSDLQDGHY
jgi:hypothetical protein